MKLGIKYVVFSAEKGRKLPVAAAKARCNTLSAITDVHVHSICNPLQSMPLGKWTLLKYAFLPKHFCFITIVEVVVRSQINQDPQIK